jgi:Protein of unknown function (DUF1524)
LTARRLIAVVAAGLLVSLMAATGAGAHPVTVSKAEHAPLSVEAARVMLHGLKVADPHVGGYKRAAFGDGWSADPETGCTTRQLVLQAEAVDGHPNPHHRCRTIGVWVDWYSTGSPAIGKPKQIEIDHLVPLANAWHSGAWAWPTERLVAYANDLVHPYALTAVSVHQNQAKAASGPERWQPPNKKAHCAYAIDWIAVKHDWTLTVTGDEHQALDRMLNECPPPTDPTVTVASTSPAAKPADTTSTAGSRNSIGATTTIMPATSTPVLRPTVTLPVPPKMTVPAGAGRC